jgi:TolB-like protein
VRITGQLSEAATGAQKFEGELQEVFDLQDSVSTSVVGATTNDALAQFAKAIDLEAVHHRMEFL